MNYIERLLESQFASDELKDYLDKKHKKGNPKLSQKYKVATSGEKNKEVNRRAKGLQDAPNAHRFAVQLNAKLRYNKIHALAEPDGKYRNLIWVLAYGNRLNRAFKYINEFLGLEPNNNNIEIGDYQIRLADVSKQGVQQYFIRQNGLGFKKTIEELMSDTNDDVQQDYQDVMNDYNDKMKSKEETSDGETIDLDKDEQNNTKNSEEKTKEESKEKSEDEMSHEEWVEQQFKNAKKSDEYHEDVIGFDPKKKKPIYKPYSKGWWAQRGEKAKELGFDPSKWNFDPTTWKMSQSLKKAS